MAHISVPGFGRNTAAIIDQAFHGFSTLLLVMPFLGVAEITVDDFYAGHDLRSFSNAAATGWQRVLR